MTGKSWFKLMVIFILLFSGFACKKAGEEQKSQGKLPPPPPTTGKEVLPSPEVGKQPVKKPGAIPPEKYYQFELEWRRTEKEMQKKYLELVKSASELTSDLEEKLNALDQQMAEKYGELKKKYGITFPDLQRTITEPESKKALDKYLSRHPEIKKELDELEQIINQQKEEYQKELKRIFKGKTPPSEEGCPGCEKGEEF